MKLEFLFNDLFRLRLASSVPLICLILTAKAIDPPSSGRIRLEDARIRVAAFGDSIVWGQGLHEHEKFYWLVADMLGIRAGADVEKNLLAHSGAIIVTDDSDGAHHRYHGEIPHSYPTINEQVDSFAAFPETIDLVIIDGGINDVSVSTIINPSASETVIDGLSRRSCFTEMKDLLHKVTGKFPNARIVVTGYFQIVSEHTDQDGFEALFDIYGFLAGGEGNDAVIRNCRVFHRASMRDLREAVNAVNASLTASGKSARVLFADPSFLPENATFAPQSWLWGLNLDASPLTLYLDPVDPWADFREDNCEFLSLGYAKCRRASMGHPTPRGARAYASAIAAALGFAWVDFSRASGGNDRMEFPFHTLSRALDHVPIGGTVLIKSSNSAETIRITKPCKLEACGGTVVIGRN